MKNTNTLHNIFLSRIYCTIPYSTTTGGGKMNKQKALNILGNRAVWELRNMKKALSVMEIFNTKEENERLEAVKTLLRIN